MARHLHSPDAAGQEERRHHSYLSTGPTLRRGMLSALMGVMRKQVVAIDSASTLRNLLREIFPGEHIALPPNADAMLRLHAPLPDQRPATCGAYILTYVLPSRGFTRLDGESLGSEDYMAHLARVTINAREDRATYRFDVKASADPSKVGTSPAGVARAVAVATEGRLGTIPVPGRDTDGNPQLEGRRWDALLELISAHLLSGTLDVIFNYDSDQLLAARDDAYNEQNLVRADASHLIPLDRWGVGHFAPMAALWMRPFGEQWMVLLNSFKARGFAGVEPQPAELMSRAVVRKDQREGGALLIVPATRSEGLAREIEEVGLEIRMWDNGSSAPDDWRWSRSHC